MIPVLLATRSRRLEPTKHDGFYLTYSGKFTIVRLREIIFQHGSEPVLIQRKLFRGYAKINIPLSLTSSFS